MCLCGPGQGRTAEAEPSHTSLSHSNTLQSWTGPSEMSYRGKCDNLGILISASHWSLAVSGREDNLRRSGSLEPRTILSELCSYGLSAYLRYIIYIIYVVYDIRTIIYHLYTSPNA